MKDATGPSRRSFLKAAAGSAVLAPLGIAADMAGESTDHQQAVLALFAALPGDKAVRIFAPAAKGKPAFSVDLNPERQFFVGSAVKTFILAEALRQADTPDVVQTLTTKQLALDASVWNLDSATFNPPNLIGAVSERTALEAMIQHSDNTGTDMSLKLAGPDNVRRFIASAQLNNTVIPDSTRSLFGYLLGAKDYKTFSWMQLIAATNSPMVNSPMNKEQTMASSAADFVSYYSRACKGSSSRTKRRSMSTGESFRLGMRSGSYRCRWEGVRSAKAAALTCPDFMRCALRAEWSSRIAGSTLRLSSTGKQRR
jgi:beta-lactamase class A